MSISTPEAPMAPKPEQLVHDSNLARTVAEAVDADYTAAKLYRQKEKAEKDKMEDFEMGALFEGADFPTPEKVRAFGELAVLERRRAENKIDAILLDGVLDEAAAKDKAYTMKPVMDAALQLEAQAEVAEDIEPYDGDDDATFAESERYTEAQLEKAHELREVAKGLRATADQIGEPKFNPAVAKEYKALGSSSEEEQ